MTIPVAGGSAGLPVVNQALEPKWVRDGSASTQKAYEGALAFEQTLVEQLSRSLTATSGFGGESSQEGGSSSEEGGATGADAGNGELSSLLPQALTSSVMNAGGLGLAGQMTHELAGVQSEAHTRASGGTAASAASGAHTTVAVGNVTNGGTGV